MLYLSEMHYKKADSKIRGENHNGQVRYKTIHEREDQKLVVFEIPNIQYIRYAALSLSWGYPLGLVYAEKI